MIPYASIVFWLGLTGAVTVLLYRSYLALKPPDITPMSDEWMKHMEYQLTKPGGAMAQFGRDEDGQ